MTLFNIDRFTILEPRLDWISVIGDIPQINYEDEDVCTEIENKFCDWGFMKVSKRDRLTFRSDLMGTEISLGRKRNSGNRYVKIEIQGKGCADSVENTEHKIKETIKKVWDFFGVATPPHATRIDLAVDILGARLSDIFPDISDKKYGINSNSRKPTIQLSKYHRNPYDLSEQTGFTAGNSRFEICCYDRILAIKEKYLHQDNGKAYCDYYLKLYKGYERVLRIETRPSKELCEFFNVGFFTNKKSLRDLLPESLAHFNHHHGFKDVEENKNLEHIDRLYFSTQFKTIKTLKSELGLDLDLKKLFFNLGSKNYEMRISQLARSLVRCEKTSKDDMTMVMGSLLTAINKASSDLESEITDFNKTCEFMNFHPEEQEARTQEFLSIVNKLRETRMKNNSLVSNDDFLYELENQLGLLGLV